MDTIEAENNFPPDFLSQAHLDFMVGFLEIQAQREQAVIDAFLREEAKLSSMKSIRPRCLEYLSRHAQ
jgi:hypothetical protein